MKIQYVDELYITRPMSTEERFELLKALQQQSYLQGIDKGTLLERDTVFRIQNLRKQNLQKKYLSMIDRLNDYIHIGVRRHKRLKYKGRYNYSKKKKTTTAHTTNPTITLTNLPAWLQ